MTKIPAINPRRLFYLDAHTDELYLLGIPLWILTIAAAFLAIFIYGWLA